VQILDWDKVAEVLVALILDHQITMDIMVKLIQVAVAVVAQVEAAVPVDKVPMAGQALRGSAGITNKGIQLWHILQK
jgi:hypothetical protein